MTKKKTKTKQKSLVRYITGYFSDTDNALDVPVWKSIVDIETDICMGHYDMDENESVYKITIEKIGCIKRESKVVLDD